MQTKDNDGFTLIEILYVIILIGVVMIIATPTLFHWLPNMQLKGVARDLYSNMQKARMTAVKTRKDTAIIFNPANNSYEMCLDWDAADTSGAVPVCGGEVVKFNDLSYGIGFGHGNANAQADTAGALPLTPNDNVSYSGNVAIFNSRGLGDNDGCVYLDNKNDTAYAISSLISGVIMLQRWVGGHWE